MTPYTGSLKWYTLSKAVLDYANTHSTSVFSRVSVVPGLIAWDGCDCGALYIMVNQVYFSETFPDQRATADLSAACGAPYEVAEFVMQVMECAPTPQGNATETTVAAEDAAARLVRRDAYEVRRAVNTFLCQSLDAFDIVDYIVDTQIAQGPSGGCVGTELRFRVGLDRD